MIRKINALKIAGEAFSQISIKFDPEMVTIPEEFQEISGRISGEFQRRPKIDYKGFL